MFGSEAERKEWGNSSVLTFKRPADFITGKVCLFDGIEPNDIGQGALGDCWFCCALASVAEEPKEIERLFVTKKTSANGM